MFLFSLLFFSFLFSLRFSKTLKVINMISSGVTSELRALAVQEPIGLRNTGRAAELRKHRKGYRSTGRATEAPE
jgi:hypothetical protein